MARRPIVAVLGGTFDRIHAGHLALLDAAFSHSDQVGIGLTTAKFLADHPKPLADRIRGYSARRRSLVQLLRERYPGRQYTIVPLNDPFGGSVRPGWIESSFPRRPERGLGTVNARRRELRLPPVRVIVVPRVLGEDLRPIAGRRIRAGEIDASGHRRTPLVVRVRSNDPALLEVARRSVAIAFRGIPFAWDARRISGRPRGLASVGAAPRFARRASMGADLGIALLRHADRVVLAAAATPDGPIGALRLSARTGPESVRRLAEILRSHPTAATTRAHGARKEVSRAAFTENG